MGSPKHLLKQEGSTWLERTIALLAPKTQQLVLSGAGDIPTTLATLPRVPDAAGIAGPLAGIVAVLRWQPAVSWLIMACDLPDVQPEAIDWLLAQRKPGCVAVLPQLREDSPLEPLLAWYDFRCLPLLEELATSGPPRLNRLFGQAGVCVLQPPASLHRSWRNVNTPEELHRSSLSQYHKQEPNGSRLRQK